MSILDTALGFAGQSLGGSKEPQAVAQSVRNIITVVPPEFNSGEILSQAFNQGSYHNGGFGLQIPSRYFQRASSGSPTFAATSQKDEGLNLPLILGLGAAAVAVVLLVR